MQSPIAVLNSLDWLWRENGVEIGVNLDGRPLRVFIPIGRVTVTFHRELAREGYQPQPRVGGHSVGGLFGDIGHAFSSIGRGATRAVSRATSTLARTASKWGSKALDGAVALGRNKWVRGGLAAASLAMPALAPAAVALETANRAYDAGRAAQRFIAHPTFGGAFGLASSAVPGPYGEALRQAAPIAMNAAHFAQHPSFGGALGLASQYAPGPWGGYARQAQTFAGYAHQPHMPQFAQLARRNNIFSRAMGFF